MSRLTIRDSRKISSRSIALLRSVASMETKRNQYLEMLNVHSAKEAYAAVKELASSLSDDEHLIRSCIFDLHAAVENELRRIFYHTFKAHLFLTNEEEKNKETLADFDKMIGRLGFMEMYRVLRPILKWWPSPDLQWIQYINETRTLAAHKDSMETVLYRGRNPFRDADCFAQMFLDVWAIRQSLAKYFEIAIDAPIARLERYIKKYGHGAA